MDELNSEQRGRGPSAGDPCRSGTMRGRLSAKVSPGPSQQAAFGCPIWLQDSNVDGSIYGLIGGANTMDLHCRAEGTM